MVQVNKELLPMKAHYFLWNAGTSPVVPFLSTYARQLGFSSVIVGIIYTILPICGMFAKPIFGAIADRFHSQKAIFLISQIVTILAFLGIFYSPELPVEKTVHFSCTDGLAVFNTIAHNNATIDDCLVKKIQLEDKLEQCKLQCQMNKAAWSVICNYWNVSSSCGSTGGIFDFDANVPATLTEKFDNTLVFRVANVSINNKIIHPHCPENASISVTCQAECMDYTINEAISQPAIEDDYVYGLYEFWLFLTLMVIGWIGQAIVVSVGDAICFELLGDQPERYGYQRLFGAMGWGIFSTIAGVMIDSLSEGQAKKNFISAFYLSVAILLVDFLVSYKLQYKQKHSSESIIRDVGRLLTNLRIFIFLIWCIAVGMCTAIMWQFLFWLIEDLARDGNCDSQSWIKTLEGLVMAIQCLGGEMPFFFMSGWILKKLGHINAMTLVLFAIGVRFVLYSVISDPWWFLPIEFSNGLTFGLFYACMASYASIVAPPGTETTIQGMVGAVFEGVGVSIGSFTAGILYKQYGGPITFRIFGIGALIVCMLHALVQYLLKFQGSEASYSRGADDPLDSIGDDDQQELTLVDEF